MDSGKRRQEKLRMERLFHPRHSREPEGQRRSFPRGRKTGKSCSFRAAAAEPGWNGIFQENSWISFVLSFLLGALCIPVGILLWLLPSLPFPMDFPIRGTRSETSRLKMASVDFFSFPDQSCSFCVGKTGKFHPIPWFFPSFFPPLPGFPAIPGFPFCAEAEGSARSGRVALWDPGILWDSGILQDTWTQRGPGMDAPGSGNAPSGAAFPG